MTKIVAGSMASLMLLLATGTANNAEADGGAQATPQQTQQAQQTANQDGIKLMKQNLKWHRFLKRIHLIELLRISTEIHKKKWASTGTQLIKLKSLKFGFQLLKI